MKDSIFVYNAERRFIGLKQGFEGMGLTPEQVRRCMDNVAGELEGWHHHWCEEIEDCGALKHEPEKNGMRASILAFGHFRQLVDDFADGQDVQTPVYDRREAEFKSACDVARRTHA